MVATVQQDEVSNNARSKLRRALKKFRFRRGTRKEDDKLLKRVDTDKTLDTFNLMPKTLSEALPEDPVERANDPRAIVVTECTGTLNMIGCNKAWENLCG